MKIGEREKSLYLKLALNFGLKIGKLFETSEGDKQGIGYRPKTQIWSCTGSKFIAENPDTDTFNIDNGKATAEGNGIFFHAPVELPNNAIITSIIVYGNTAAEQETWSLRRILLSSGGSVNMTQVTVNIGTETFSQDFINKESTIDNNKYAYWLKTSTLDTNNEIRGARIKYII